jgi:hypothetical protein
MFPAVLLVFLAASAADLSGGPWPWLSLSIEKDPGYSSDVATVCRVRVVNHGSRAWPGRNLHFEARAIDGGVPVERVHGRFGLQLAPYGELETLVGFSGVYHRFEVVSVDGPKETSSSRKRGGAKGKRPRRRPRR